MSTPMRRPSRNQFIEVRAGRFEGAPVGERRRWSDAFKGRAIAASLEPGVNISALARSLEIMPSQLFGWRGAAATPDGGCGRIFNCGLARATQMAFNQTRKKVGRANAIWGVFPRVSAHGDKPTFSVQPPTGW